MKIILVLLASALSMAQAARLGLLRVNPYGPTKGKLASAKFGYSRTLKEQDAFYALRELVEHMSMSMSMPLSMPMPYEETPYDETPYEETPYEETATSAPVPTPTPTVIDSLGTAWPGTAAPQVDPSGTAAPIDPVATSPSPTPAPQVTIAAFTASPTPAPTGGVDLGLPTPTGDADQGLSSANQAENSGGASGPDTRQTVLFIVAAFAAVAVGATLMARKFSAASGTSSTNGSVYSAPSQASAPSQEPAADGRLVDVGL